MFDRVTISNLALSRLGETDRIRDPDDDTKVAREVRAVWDTSRRTVLRAAMPNFATTRAAVPALALSGPELDAIYPFAHAFEPPVGMLRFVEILDPPLSGRKYRYEGGRLLADVTGPLRVRGIVDVPDTTRWDDSFVEAFANFLAWAVADAISGDRGRKLDALAAYREQVGPAKAASTRENPPERHPESSWIEARWRP